MAPTAAPDMEQDGAGDRFRRYTEDVIRRLAERGGVILGRGATVILRDDPRGLRVRLDGPPEGRIRRVVERQGIDEATAGHDQKHTDRARKAYLRHFYWVDGADPRQYDLVIDTTRVSDQEAVDRIVEMAKHVPVAV